MSAYWGHLATVRFLRGKGAAADVAAYNGWTPLFAAAAMHMESLLIVKYLHQNGAKIR
jgi:ankyrin repeat protein